MSTTWLRRTAPFFACLTLVLCASASCKRKASEAPTATYTVKGVVKMLPPAAKPGTDKAIVVLHQAVPTFKDREGQEVGMMAMPMPFTLADGIDMKDIVVGSKVEFTFGVFWQAPTPTRILALKRLPDDTQINFSGE